MQALDTSLMLSLFNQLERRGVRYGYGAKADDKTTNPRSTGRLSTPVDTIDQIDCSGFTRYITYQATSGAVTLPDGSQDQLDWFSRQKDKTISKLGQYSDLTKVAGPSLFVGFIKPHVNGCGDIGHVWFAYKDDQTASPETMESHGGTGVDSRPWNTLVLRNEVFSAFQLPIT